MASVDTLTPETVAVEPLKLGKSIVYRLRLGGRTLVAKRARLATARVERTVYQDVLARLPLPHVACLAFVEEREHAWLFLDDAGDERLSGADSDRRRVARWLARLHHASRSLADHIELPRRDAAFHLDVVAQARRALEQGAANSALGASGVRAVDVLLEGCARLEANAGVLEALAASFPPSLVHGGLAGKNVRLRGGDVLAFDWEAAGWGVPLADLARAHAGEYVDETTRLGAAVDATWLEAAQSLGRALWCLAAVRDESEHLAAPWASRIAGKLEWYAAETEAALRDERS